MGDTDVHRLVKLFGAVYYCEGVRSLRNRVELWN